MITDTWEPTWNARCGVCGMGWTVRQTPNPSPHGSFCPNCRNNKLSAPGVLHWKLDAGDAEYQSWFQVPKSHEKRLEAALEEICRRADDIRTLPRYDPFREGFREGWSQARDIAFKALRDRE